MFPGVIFSHTCPCDSSHPFSGFGVPPIAVTKGKGDQPEVGLTLTLLPWTQPDMWLPCQLNLACSCCFLPPGRWVVFPGYAEELFFLFVVSLIHSFLPQILSGQSTLSPMLGTGDETVTPLSFELFPLLRMVWPVLNECNDGML